LPVVRGITVQLVLFCRHVVDVRLTLIRNIVLLIACVHAILKDSESSSTVTTGSDTQSIAEMGKNSKFSVLF